MSVIEKLLRLHLVDQQIHGLRLRVDGAERYLKEQDRLLEGIQARHDALAGQIRQLQATVHNDETEMKAIDDRIAKHREQLNAAQTNKEYSALLTEVNTLKADRGLIEERALESLTRLDEVKAAMEKLDAERTERSRIREAAKTDRDARAREIQDRLDELKQERVGALAEVPAEAMRVYDAQVHRRADEAMAPIEEQDRRNMEYSCGNCQVMLPIELVSAILGRGEIRQCVSCGSILYIDQALREAMMPAKR